MKINSCKNNITPSFHAGLTSKMCEDIRGINVKALEKEFAKHNIICNFKQDKSIAGAMTYAINLCQQAAERFGLPFHYTPPSIRVFETHELIDPSDSENFGFCTWGKMPVIKYERMSNFGDIYINKFAKNENITTYNEDVEKLHKLGIISSDHFLGQFLHELFHNIHLNLLFERYGIENCIGTNDEIGELEKILHKKFSILDKTTVRKNISKQATNSYCELFSEVLSKALVDSLVADTLEFKSNPMDELKNYPQRVQKFIKKQLL